MKLNKLTLKDKKIFDHFLGQSEHALSVYAFANIFIWRSLFEINWSVIEDCLCVFFQDKIGAFVYLSPLGENKKDAALEKVFLYLNKINKNPEISRIENIEAGEIGLYGKLGYRVKQKSLDYVCARADLANLSGNKFKSKRSSYNYFLKHNNFKYLNFSLRHKQACLKLYNLWSRQRRLNAPDPLYQWMLEDSLKSLKLALKDYKELNLEGRVVQIGNEVRAFTFGFRLNPQTFCVLYEITDLSVKGLAQFIFCSFCRDLRDYRYINIMDDSGLMNLKKVKLSYKPIKLIPAYIAKMPAG